MKKDRAPASAGASVLTVAVWRGDANGHFQEFEVPRQESQTVLDVVTYIQRHLDATLAYRFACRVGMCGSCAMMVNGTPRWTCRSHVDKVARDTDRDFIMSAEEAMGYGIIDEVITTRELAGVPQAAGVA